MPLQPVAAHREQSHRASAEYRQLAADHAETQRQLETVRAELEKRTREFNSAKSKRDALAKELKELKPKSTDRGKIEKIKSSSVYDAHAKNIADDLQRFDRLDIIPLLMRAITKLEKHFEIKLFALIPADPRFYATYNEIIDARDAAIHKRLTSLLDGDTFSLMRLICKISKRECHLMYQVFKWQHHADGTKTRNLLGPDSKYPAPALFDVASIEASETRAAEASKLVLREHADGRGADISGKPGGLDQAIYNALESTKTDRTRGMATKGTADDPHMGILTGDGAGLSGSLSGVRVAFVPGSTRGLNQSSLDVTNLLMYAESRKAEDYVILRARLANLLPDLLRLYKDPVLVINGERTDIHIRIVLTGDKPFIRHVLGLVSQNADAFGRPYCDCHDIDLYYFLHDTRTHYGDGTLPFDELCIRAHVPPWQARREEEPAQWTMTCKCCKQTWGSHDRGLERLQADRTRKENLSDVDRRKEDEKHVAAHHGQAFDHPPLLPCHYVIFDPMHGMHMEGNVLFDEAIHQHFLVESPEPEVMELLQKKQTEINELWSKAHLPKLTLWGKDQTGAHAHAMNGPTFKAVMRNVPLLTQSFEIMADVYELMDAKKLTPELDPKELDRVPVPVEKSKRKSNGGKKQQKQQRKKKKARGSAFAEVEQSDEEEAEDAHPANEDNEDEDEVPNQDATSAPPPVTPEAVRSLTYGQRVGAALVAYFRLYEWMHDDHNTLIDSPTVPGELERRDSRADTAVRLALDLQRGMIALIGTHRRRTYAHDLVYGMRNLYRLLGRPWNGSTEGNEHAHQDMKQFYLHLSCHSSKRGGDIFQVLRLLTVKQMSLRLHAARVLPCSAYAAMRANTILAKEAAKEKDVKGLKMYKEDKKMAEGREAVQMQLCAPCEREG